MVDVLFLSLVRAKVRAIVSSCFSRFQSNGWYCKIYARMFIERWVWHLSVVSNYWFFCFQKFENNNNFRNQTELNLYIFGNRIHSQSEICYHQYNEPVRTTLHRYLKGDFKASKSTSKMTFEYNKICRYTIKSTSCLFSSKNHLCNIIFVGFVSITGIRI